MKKKEIDVTVPFIAIREDVKGTEFEPTMGEYLCNPLAVDLLDAEVTTGGFFSDESGVIEGGGEPKPSFVVPAGKAVRFTLSTWDEYCEMVCYWKVRYRTTSSTFTSVSFATYKGLADTQALADVPALGGRAIIVPQSNG